MDGPDQAPLAVIDGSLLRRRPHGDFREAEGWVVQRGVLDEGRAFQRRIARELQTVRELHQRSGRRDGAAHVLQHDADEIVGRGRHGQAVVARRLATLDGPHQTPERAGVRRIVARRHDQRLRRVLQG